MSDPLSDPRATQLLNADPGEVSQVAQFLRMIGIQAQDAASGLRGASGDGSWTGPAAAAFRTTLGKVPPELDTIHGSYADAAGALDTYEDSLSRLKPAFSSIKQQIESTQQTVGSLSSTLSNQRATLHAANINAAADAKSGASASALKTDSKTATADGNDVSATSGQLSQAQSELSGLQQQGMHLLDQFSTARSSVSSSLSAASSHAPHQSWLDHMLGDVGNFMGDVGHFFAGIGKGIWDGVTGLPGAVVNFAEHPSWDNFETLAEDVAITASVATLALMPFDAPEVAALAEGLDTTAAVASRADGVSEILQGHYADGAIALAFSKAPDAGDVAGVGEKAADTAETQAKGLSAYSKAITDDGGNQIKAFKSLNAEQQEALKVSDGVYVLPTASQATRMTEAAETQASNAARNARLIGRPLSFAADNTITDPAKDKTTQGVNYVLHGSQSGS
jgi:hypothetical protein